MQAIPSFISRYKTKVNSCLSDTVESISDTVRGSDIGPVMFLVFNELISILEQHKLASKSFADDVKMYLIIVDDLHHHHHHHLIRSKDNIK